ncbi:MAG: cell wall hydrolase [Clostridia bacterium]|nr:cell wall hydrolase [Clostridia bacterium]
MRRYTLKENLISALIGVAIGIPFSIYAVNHQTPSEPIRTITPEPITYEVTTEVEEEVYTEPLIWEEDRYLLACLVYAEAGNQDLTGKRLVVDVVLNRVDSDTFPDTIPEVIFQKYQFAPVLDGGLERAFSEVTDECYEAVDLELERRLDYKILYFTADDYGAYGTHAYQHGDHYFCYE